ncbi:MAG: hypothetical protein ATN35_00425 [Epulopiscium sp. Nele67-Bin004]|nr:MAG: hypothetical protein ATN35_00425 [Epulopiscium sp. Nele67-Bin004]
MNQAILTLKIDKTPHQRDVEKLRGYISSLKSEEVLLHNHIDDYDFRYKAPLIQYKLINNQLGVVAYDKGVQILETIYPTLNTLNLKGETVPITSKALDTKPLTFEVSTQLHRYKLQTPWIAINQENYKRYRAGEFDLNRQMQNNILSNFKDLGIRIDQQIMCNGKFEPTTIVLKDTKLIAFFGEFVTNIDIPNYMGVGKRKSIGYGTLIKID